MMYTVCQTTGKYDFWPDITDATGYKAFLSKRSEHSISADSNVLVKGTLKYTILGLIGSEGHYLYQLGIDHATGIFWVRDLFTNSLLKQSRNWTSVANYANNLPSL